MSDKDKLYAFLKDVALRVNDISNSKDSELHIVTNPCIIYITLAESSRNSRLYTASMEHYMNADEFAKKYIDDFDEWFNREIETFQGSKRNFTLSADLSGSGGHISTIKPFEDDRTTVKESAGFAQMLGAAGMDQMSYSKSRPITYSDVYDGVLRLKHMKSRPYEEVSESLKSAGFTWTIEEVQRLADKLEAIGVKTPDLNDGLISGNVITGASFIANTISSSMGYSYVDEWNFDSCGSPSIGQWIEAAKLILGKE